MRNQWQAPKQRRSEDDTCQYFSDDLGLAKPHEDVSQQLGKSDKK
jgi:hypothetical protein